MIAKLELQEKVKQEQKVVEMAIYMYLSRLNKTISGQEMATI